MLHAFVSGFELAQIRSTDASRGWINLTVVRHAGFALRGHDSRQARRVASQRTSSLLSTHCTFAVTDASPDSVNVQVRALFPPLEHAPVQIASRPLVTLSVIDVPAANEAEPVAPTLTLIPAGLDVTLSPLRPVAVTVSVAV
jgi:hypothetical protein